MLQPIFTSRILKIIISRTSKQIGTKLKTWCPSYISYTVYDFCNDLIYRTPIRPNLTEVNPGWAW